MTALRIPNKPARNNAQAPAHPLKENGSWHKYLMVVTGQEHSIIYADTLAELIEIFIPHYTELTTEEKFFKRMQKAQDFHEEMKRLTSLFIATANPSLDPWEKEVIEAVISNKACVYGWADGTQDIAVGSDKCGESQPRDYWKSEIPLPVLETDYSPFTNVPLPLSAYGDYLEVENIIWFRSATEESFLLSLSHAGFIEMGTPSIPAKKSSS